MHDAGHMVTCVMLATAHQHDALPRPQVRVAAETLVQPLGQQVELLPRVEEVLAAQQAALRAYGLGYEVVGSGGAARLRILPSSSAGGKSAAGSVQAQAQVGSEMQSVRAS